MKEKGVVLSSLAIWERKQVPPPPEATLEVTQGLVKCGSVLIGPVYPSFRALSEHLKSTVRLHKFNEYFFLGTHQRTCLAETGC